MRDNEDSQMFKRLSLKTIIYKAYVGEEVDRYIARYTHTNHLRPSLGGHTLAEFLSYHILRSRESRLT